ncbi:unnamed protein product [Porites lobata]|uniref:Transposase Helix-turn-helix domain-containing protein n=1 Tax=Porites lobata TaxID=104759 RepID=A0ABN8QQL2_9CNID|nr:unnamed protein product [Porites lobata]
MLRYWCRRKQLLLIMLSIITLINPPRDRICWMRPNSDDWFILADSTFNREQWYENFRVTRDTFTIILNEIEHDIAKQDTPMRKAVPTRKKLAMTLYYFASTAEFRTIANLFGVSRAFLCYHCVVMQALVDCNYLLGMLSLDGQGVYTMLASCQTQLFMTKETTITCFQI